MDCRQLGGQKVGWHIGKNGGPAEQVEEERRKQAQEEKRDETGFGNFWGHLMMGRRRRRSDGDGDGADWRMPNAKRQKRRDCGLTALVTLETMKKKKKQQNGRTAEGRRERGENENGIGKWAAMVFFFLINGFFWWAGGRYGKEKGMRWVCFAAEVA